MASFHRPALLIGDEEVLDSFVKHGIASRHSHTPYLTHAKLPI